MFCYSLTLKTKKIILHFSIFENSSSTFYIFYSIQFSLPAVASCEQVKCSNYGSCILRQGRSACVCPVESDCSATVNPVCGNDSRTYSSECVMRSRSCNAGILVVQQYEGACGKLV